MDRSCVLLDSCPWPSQLAVKINVCLDGNLLRPRYKTAPSSIRISIEARELAEES